MDPIKLRQDNPYSIGTILAYIEGDLSLERNALVHVKSKNDKLHTVKDYDNLSDMAFDYYGSSKWWWVINDINNLEDGFALVPGSILIIPDLLKIKVSVL